MKYKTPESYTKPIKIGFDIKLKYQYFIDREHPLSDRCGKVYYHRHIASIKIGRWLKSNEHVHHINEKRWDNNEGNLLITSRKGHGKYHRRLNREIIKCLYCKKEIETIIGKQKYCSDYCRCMGRRLFEIPKKELKKLIWSKPTTKIANEFNVSDVAISKRCKILGIKKPPRGYWMKKNGRKKWDDNN